MKLLLIFWSLFFASGFNINFLQDSIVEKPIKECPEYLEKYVVPLKYEYGDKIIKTATSSLPNADFTGHYILKTNEYLINNLLDTNFIDIDHKKQIILWLIEQTMKGDAMGGKILDLYYDIVNCLL
jgi:hypothetical protein